MSDQEKSRNCVQPERMKVNCPGPLIEEKMKTLRRDILDVKKQTEENRDKLDEAARLLADIAGFLRLELGMNSAGSKGNIGNNVESVAKETKLISQFLMGNGKAVGLITRIDRLEQLRLQVHGLFLITIPTCIGVGVTIWKLFL